MVETLLLLLRRGSRLRSVVSSKWLIVEGVLDRFGAFFVGMFVMVMVVSMGTYASQDTFDSSKWMGVSKTIVPRG